ncbi:MAG TPA: DUF3820 family protein [Chitinophagales bacterium]|nr:DUF3820 family protein [Chitinophagales bacterium]
MVDPKILLLVIETKMPFGKHKDKFIYQIPISYLEWMRNNDGFPKGQLGMLLETIYVIKMNGIEFLLKPLLKNRKSFTD